MSAIQEHADLELKTVVTGMHLVSEYGNTVEDIEADGFDVDRRVHSEMAGDSGLTMAKGLGTGISGIAETFGELNPDAVLVLGDRDEAFAGGVAAAHMNVPVAHVHGGDTMRGAMIDDSIRHALTKFAHIHFPASKRSQNRILKLGEEPWRVTLVGAPGLDRIREDEYSNPESVTAEYGFNPNDPLVLVVQHPVTTSPEDAGDQMETTLEAITTLDADPEVAVIYPNSDPGNKQMIDVIERFAQNERIRTFRNLPRNEYLGLMAAADVMVGNSSSGIIEAPSLRVRVVDIGPRQANRERSSNTIAVEHDTDAIRTATNHCLAEALDIEEDGAYDNPYDHGHAGSKIADRLASVELDEVLLRKQLTF